MMVIDVRNPFEYAIGHFVHSSPLTNENDSYSDEIDGENQVKKEAINPSFDKSFCEKNAESLKDKNVLMYCTGGIRCEKANAILRKHGVEDVSQLSRAIRRYLEQFGSSGFLKGKISSFTNALSWIPMMLKGMERLKANHLIRMHVIIGLSENA